MANGALDSHLSQRSSTQPNETENVRQHHRLALGEKITGQTQPNGATPNGKSTISNGGGKTY